MCCRATIFYISQITASVSVIWTMSPQKNIKIIIIISTSYTHETQGAPELSSFYSFEEALFISVYRYTFSKPQNETKDTV